MELIADKYKQTEFGLIPEDWNIVEFQEVMDGFSSGQTPYRGKPEFYKGNIPWITSGELNYNVITDTKEKITPEGLRYANLKIIPKGTFLFAITGLEAAGTRGSCAITGIDATTNQSCMALYPKVGLLTTAYLYHFYVRYGNELAFKYCQGTKQQSYTGGIAKKLPIIVPPTIAEQTAIATALSDMDALISNLEKLIEKKRMIKQGVMQDLLTGGKNNSRLKGNWTERQIGFYLNIKHGKDQKKIQNLTGNYPILGTSGIIGWSDKFLYDKPSVLIGRKGTIDRPQYFDTPFWTIDTLFYSEIKDNCDPKFLYYKFQMIPWKNFNEASGVPSLSAKQVESISIRCPNEVKEQIEIREIIDSISDEIVALEQLRDKYSLVKQGMMQSLLTGKIRLA